MFWFPLYRMAGFLALLSVNWVGRARLQVGNPPSPVLVRTPPVHAENSRKMRPEIDDPKTPHSGAKRLFFFFFPIAYSALPSTLKLITLLDETPGTPLRCPRRPFFPPMPLPEPLGWHRNINLQTEHQEIRKVLI